MPTIERLYNIPLQLAAQYAQTSLSGRFQHYTDKWFEEGGNSRTELMDFGLIKEMKVAMFLGLWDSTCPLTKNVEARTQMGEDTVVEWIV